MGSHAATLGDTPSAGADHQIVFAFDNRPDQARDHLRPVATVAIEKHQNLSPSRACRGGTPSAGPTVAGLLFDEYGGTGGTSLGHPRIPAAAIDHDDFVKPAARHRRNDLADCPLLVEHRDDRGDARLSPLAYRLQPTPHDAQAAGGSLL